jgi:hypothetical protein
MARMIPAYIDEDAPPGERAVFAYLAAGPADWVAIHSLDLSPFNRGRRTEVDFVVIVPDTGILCIEVKSQLSISFDGERWLPPEIKKSPFKQAADARYVFYRRLVEVAPMYGGIPVVHHCVFTSATFDIPRNLSVQSWELTDGRAFQTLPSADDFCMLVRFVLERSIESDQNLSPLAQPMSADRVETILGLCVPIQKRKVHPRTEIERREKDADLLLRAQQKPVLRLAALNRQLVVSGPAGTGKTLIAMEVARIAAISGARTGLICFNQLVGSWLHDRIASEPTAPPNLIVGSAIRVISEMCGISIPSDPDEGFWDRDLPNLIEERVTDPEFHADAVFDFLIIDEAQDLMARPQLWQSLSMFLDGGFETGRFLILGDFATQVIQNRDATLTALAALETRCRPARWEITENCRNYPIVGNTAASLSGFSRSIYSGFMKGGGNLENYDIIFYQNPDEQAEFLAHLLQEFKTRGYRPEEITVLSFRRDEFSIADRLRLSGQRLRPMRMAGPGTGYGSIHAFKGMENKIVILTDLNPEDIELHRTLFYVGMTRATESVRLLCDARSMQTIAAWLEKGM